MRPSRSAVLVGLLLAGCSMFDQDNRRMLRWMDAHLTPGGEGTRYALLPVTIPVGLAALCGDAVLVHPVTCIDDAWGDTVELLWTPENETSLRKVLFAPLAGLATPFVFVGDWLGRATWPIDPRVEEE